MDLQDAYKPHICETPFIAYDQSCLYCCEKHLELGADVHDLHQLEAQVNFALEQQPYKIWLEKQKFKNDK